MVTHKQLREWWRGIAEKEQFEMSKKGKQLAFKYRHRTFKIVHNPKGCEFKFNGLFKLKRWYSYALTDAEINAIGGIEYLDKVISSINNESLMGADFYPKYEFALIKHETVTELTRLY